MSVAEAPRPNATEKSVPGLLNCQPQKTGWWHASCLLGATWLHL